MRYAAILVVIFGMLTGTAVRAAEPVPRTKSVVEVLMEPQTKPLEPSPPKPWEPGGWTSREIMFAAIITMLLIERMFKDWKTARKSKTLIGGQKPPLVNPPSLPK